MVGDGTLKLLDLTWDLGPRPRRSFIEVALTLCRLSFLITSRRKSWKTRASSSCRRRISCSMVEAEAPKDLRSFTVLACSFISISRSFARCRASRVASKINAGRLSLTVGCLRRAADSCCGMGSGRYATMVISRRDWTCEMRQSIC